MTDYKVFLDDFYNYETDTLNAEKVKKIAEQKKKVQYNTSGDDRYRKKYPG